MCFWLQKDLDTFLKFRKYFRACCKKKDHFLDEDHSTLCVGILPGIITAFPEDFFLLLMIEIWILQHFSSNTSGTKFPSFHLSMFLRLVLYNLFPCAYVTVPNQRIQNNSQGIRVHLAWVHKKLLIFNRDYL